jgi:glycosyltransferase involved in cell wall biosynthesis
VPFTRIPWLVTGWPMRWQLAYILHLSRFAYAPAPRYVDICRHYAGPGTRVALAPIGATLPVSHVSRAEARRAFDIGDDKVVIGVFSPAAAGFEHQWIAAAAAALERRPDVVWLVFGFGSTTERWTVPGPNVIRLGPADAAGLGRAMRAVDVAAAPYTDGLTMRRSGAMFALAHGVPTVSSTGHLYDPALGRIAACEPSAEAFTARLIELAGDPARRAALAERAKGYRSVASMEVLAQQLITDLGGIR